MQNPKGGVQLLLLSLLAADIGNFRPGRPSPHLESEYYATILPMRDNPRSLLYELQHWMKRFSGNKGRKPYAEGTEEAVLLKKWYKHHLYKSRELSLSEEESNKLINMILEVRRMVVERGVSKVKVRQDQGPTPTLMAMWLRRLCGLPDIDLLWALVSRVGSRRIGRKEFEFLWTNWRRARVKFGPFFTFSPRQRSWAERMLVYFLFRPLEYFPGDVEEFLQLNRGGPVSRKYVELERLHQAELPLSELPFHSSIEHALIVRRERSRRLPPKRAEQRGQLDLIVVNE